MARAFRLIRLVLVVIVLSLASGSDTTLVALSAPPRAVTLSVPGGELPIVRMHRYRLAGRARPLLFWVGRDRVGRGEITWRDDGAGRRGFEFLVGTDPDLAPRRINRWGYIAETSAGRDGWLLAVMSRSNERSLAEVDARETSGSSRTEFQALGGRVERGRAFWKSTPVHASREWTIHDLAALVDDVSPRLARADPTTVSVDADARPGFLTAVAELVDESCARWPSRVPTHSIPYVFGRDGYTLRVRSARRAAPSSVWPTGSADVIEVDFEIRQRSTGNRTRFEMTYAVGGPLVGVPLRVRWQPRWWLQAELVLDADAPGTLVADAAPR